MKQLYFNQLYFETVMTYQITVHLSFFILHATIQIFFISHASCKYVLLLLLLNFLIEETVEIAMGHIHVQFTDFFTSFSN